MFSQNAKTHTHADYYFYQSIGCGEIGTLDLTEVPDIV